MSISPHRISHDIYIAPKVITDPGNGGTIRPNADLQVCEIVTGASAETRILANPTKPGIRFTLRMLTDGGGVAMVSAANGFNAVPEVSATFADAGDMLSLISVSLTATTYRWQVLSQIGAALATATGTSTFTSTATSSLTSTGTGTSTSTGSSTSTSTQSISGSDTASGTFSASATSTKSVTSTSTPTSTATASGTSTLSSSATATATGTQ